MKLLCLAALGLSLVALPLILGSLERDRGAHSWLAGEVGGSALYAVNLSFARVLPFVITAAIALALLQRLRARRVPTVMGSELRRHEPTVIWTHWLTVAGMVLALLSAAFLLRWFDRTLDVETTYVLHFIGSGIIVFAAVHHTLYQGLAGDQGLLPGSRRDAKQAVAELLGYLGVFARGRSLFGLGLPNGVRRVLQRPLRRWGVVPQEEDKYLATEKVLSYPVWAILIGLLVLTGTIKAARYLLPLPDAVLQIVTFLHDGSAVWVVIWLVAHVVPVVFVPRNWPLLRSMFTGRVPASYAEQHLPLWYRRIGGSS